MKRKAQAVWEGTGKEGKGSLSMQSGVFDGQPYSFKTRFENEDGKLGTNPEELIGAAHAGCFAMALSFQLNEAGFTADKLVTDAIVEMAKGDDGFSITHITLNLEAGIPDITEDKFMELANNAKKGCPISKALSAVPLTLNAKLL